MIHVWLSYTCIVILTLLQKQRAWVPRIWVGLSETLGGEIVPIVWLTCCTITLMFCRSGKPVFFTCSASGHYQWYSMSNSKGVISKREGSIIIILTVDRCIYIVLLKTELWVLDFQHFYWLTWHRLSAHNIIPSTTNIRSVNASANKESKIISQWNQNTEEIECRMARSVQICAGFFFYTPKLTILSENVFGMFNVKKNCMEKHWFQAKVLVKNVSLHQLYLIDSSQ